MHNSKSMILFNKKACHQVEWYFYNRMDLTLTSSNHGKLVFENSTFETQDNQGNKTGELKLNKPVEVLFEGVDTDKYKPVSMPKDSKIVESLNSIPEQFCFLIVGHWLQGEYGQDRKNIGLTIERFLTTFKHQHTKPALVIKTQSGNSSIMDRSAVLKKIDAIRKLVGGSLPNIYLIHGELPDEDINLLYNHPKIKAMVSLTKGEGFGRPLLEFTTTGKPIIASAWSGHTDFLRKDLNLLIGGKLEQVHDSAVIKDMILKESKWFEADPEQAKKAYKILYKKYKQHLPKSKSQATTTRKYWTFDKMAETLDSLFEKHIPKLSKKVDLKLPSLSSIKLPENKLKIKQ